MKALILENKVVDLAEQEFEVHPSLVWVDVPEGINVQPGWDYDGTSFSNPENSWQGQEDKLYDLRFVRDGKLKDTDHWALADTPEMTAEQIAYRQALRDITDHYSSLSEVVWPDKPQ